LHDAVLVLFDVDGTLLLSHGAGASGFQRAGRQLWGASFSLDGVSLAGRLDSVILQDAMAGTGVAGHGSTEQFRDVYVSHLKRSIVDGDCGCDPLPGALELVERVRDDADLTCGLLTGNWQASGTIKLQAAGFAEADFAVQAWADDAECRADLVNIAMRRWRRDARGGDVVVVGDTHHDV